MPTKPESHGTHREVELLNTLRDQGGSARNVVLAQLLGVSEETIRRTIKALAGNGLVERVHGGVYLTTNEAFIPIGSRLGKRTEAKIRIAQATAELIPNGSSVFIDVGSTSAFVAESLTKHSDLTVVTNGFHAAQTLAGVAGNRVFLAGGEIQSIEGGTFGQDTIDYVAKFHVDTAVFSIDGFSTGSGFLLTHPAEADLARSIATRARRTIVVADNTKFGQSAPILAFPHSCVSLVVTDKPVGTPFQTCLANWEIEVLTVSKEL